MKRAWTGVLWLAVAALPWLTGWGHPFLYDDVGMIAENPFLEDPANLAEVATGQTLRDAQVVNGRRPAVLATYFLDRALHGLEPPGWRATSLALHLGCAALLVWLLRRLGAGSFAALGAGWLFGLHPALVEAVHAPGFRADVLCLFFMLVALHGFVSVRARRGAGLAWGAGFSVLALLSKETALVLPLLLGVLMGLFPGVFPDSRRERIGMVAVGAAIAVFFFVLWSVLPVGLQALGGSWNGESLRFPETVWSVPALWTRTLRMVLVPWPLNVTPHFEPVDSALSWRFWGGGAVLAVCLAAAWRLRKRAVWVSLGLGWMLIFFLPVSNLLPLLHPVADRYLVPIVPGFALAAAWGLSVLPRRAGRSGLAVWAAVFAALVLIRIGEWRSGERLWTLAMERNPRSATAATWLGLLREEAGDVAGAREWYARAAAANPHDAAAWINRGILEGRAGNWGESEAWLRRAVEIRPESARGWHNLAVCLEGQGRAGEAAEAAERALRLRGGQGRANP